MSFQAPQYGIGIVSAEEPEDDAALPVHHLEMVWVALVRLLAGLKVVARAVCLVVSRADADVVLELQA
jgi:hypothetical protein